MTVRAVVFDLGHTLWDILPDDDGGLDRAYEEARAVVCARLGRDDLPAARALRDAVSEVLKASAESYFMEASREDQPPSHTWIDNGFRNAGLELEEALLHEITPALFGSEVSRLHCADGTCDALRDLQDAGYALGCITNTLASETTIRTMLREHGFEPLMQSVVVSAEEGWRKPHRSLFEKALRELGVAPHEAAYVGDSPLHDICGAKRAGMRAVLTHQYVRRPHEGYEHAPDAVISHVRELRDVIANW